MKTTNQIESDDTVNRDNAVNYVERVGVVEARKSVHYATGKICHCKTCFCCEVMDVVNAKLEPTRQAIRDSVTRSNEIESR